MSNDQSQPRSGLSHHFPERTVPLRNITLGEGLRQSATRFPERSAIAWLSDGKRKSLTYRQLMVASEQTAFWLLEQTAVGGRISVWSGNCVEWAVLEFGCALAGMVVASWNPGWSDAECLHACELAEPAVILAGRDTRGVALLDRARQIGGEIPAWSLEDLGAIVEGAEPRILPEPEPSDLFILQFTSGTTGRAKGAALSHLAVVNSAWIRTQVGAADEADVWVNPSPLSHVGGAVATLPGAILTGGCYVVMNRFDPGEFLHMMKQFGATRIGGVPTVLLAILEQPDWEPGQVALRAIGAGGAQVPQTLIARLMHEFDAPVLVVYGQSEYPVISLSTPGADVRLVADTVGRVAPHVELKIIDTSTGRTLPYGEKGEICVRGPCMMQCYYRAPEATAATVEADGFMHTGDLGSLDEQGYLKVLGRIRDVIIRGGENIYPAEVEEALLGSPSVAAVAVVGVPDERWGQQVAAAVRLAEGCANDPVALETFLADKLGYFKIPRKWLFVSSFPMTPNGKIAKIEVEKLFSEAFNS